MQAAVKVRSLLWYVVALACAIAVPLLLVSVLVTTQWIASERARLRAGTSEAAASAASQVDRYIVGRIAMLQALATSPAFDARDFERIDRQARELLDLQGSNIVVHDLDGQQRVNARVTWGAPLPRAPIVAVDRMVRATKAPAVSGLNTGLLSGLPLIRIVVPVLRGGEIVMTLTASLPSRALEGLLRSAGITAPYMASIADRDGVILARAENSAAFVGRMLPGYREAIGDRGVWSGSDPAGVPIEAAYRRSPLSGWLLAVAIRQAALDAPLHRSLAIFGVAALALLLIAAAAALAITRTLLGSHHRVAEAARSLGLDRELATPPLTSVRETNAIGEALFEASRRLRAQSVVLARANQDLEERVAERTRDVTAQTEILTAMLENMNQGILMIAADGTVPIANRRVMELLDLPAELMAQRPRFEAVLRHQLEKEDFGESDGGIRRWVESGALNRSHDAYERERPNGTAIEVRTVHLPSGGAVRTFTDITERRRRESALMHAEAEYRHLFENAVVGIYRASADGRLLRANPALVRLNGFATEEDFLSANREPGRGWYVEPGRRDAFLALMSADGRVTDFESEIVLVGTGERIWISETAWIVNDADGSVRCFEGMVSDVTNRRRAEAEIRHMAGHDTLTSLPNRASFGRFLQAKLEAGPAPAASLALLYLDLDRFKTVNDTLGHATGDALLQHVANRIAGALGVEDMAARLGGDEFAVVQIGADQPADAEMLARYLIDVVGQPCRIEGRLIDVGVSIGIATLREDAAASSEQLFADADIALYRAKSAGRSTFVRYRPGMDSDMQDRRRLELDLGGAVERGELFVHYQPAMRVDGSRISSVEALVRWQHPVRGVCPPDAFIPLAEETGLIVGIGEWVLRTACLAAASWPQDVTISVNISGVQFTTGDLRESVVRALAASRLAPERLELEITETVLIANSAEILATLATIRAYGVRIALDDFGVGFSSLGYLRRFRFDKIKIDRSFVADVDNPDTLDIIRAIVSLGARRGMTITAEGVETSGQLALIAAEGCTEAQGYLISRPIPGEDVCAFLSDFTARRRAA